MAGCLTHERHGELYEHKHMNKFLLIICFTCWSAFAYAQLGIQWHYGIPVGEFEEATDASVGSGMHVSYYPRISIKLPIYVGLDIGNLWWEDKMYDQNVSTSVDILDRGEFVETDTYIQVFPTVVRQRVSFAYLCLRIMAPFNIVLPYGDALIGGRIFQSEWETTFNRFRIDLNGRNRSTTLSYGLGAGLNIRVFDFLYMMVSAKYLTGPPIEYVGNAETDYWNVAAPVPSPRDDVSERELFEDSFYDPPSLQRRRLDLFTVSAGMYIDISNFFDGSDD